MKGKQTSLLGYLVIGVLLIVWYKYSEPTQQEIEKAREQQTAQQQVRQETSPEKPSNTVATATDTVPTKDTVVATPLVPTKPKGLFSDTVVHRQDKDYVIENNLIKITVSQMGGQVREVEMKKYDKYDSSAMMLLDKTGNNRYSFNFYANNVPVSTGELSFQAVGKEHIEVEGEEVKKIDWGTNTEPATEAQALVLRRYTTDRTGYIQYTYRLPHNSFMVDFDIEFVGLENYMRGQNDIELNWQSTLLSGEINQTWEKQYSSVHYRFYNGEVEDLSDDDDKEILDTRLHWIAFKQQFFSSVLLANDNFSSATVTQQKYPDSKSEIGVFAANISVPLEQKTELQLYYGPNLYSLLEQYEDSRLKELVYLGYPIVSWANKWIIIPLFNLLGHVSTDYGIVILLLTLVIKIFLFPLTFRSYKSMAKMRLLKPELDELTKKFGKDKQMEKQRATMDLYKQAGVNPFGGCLPMLLQMPILFAMFFFFPGAFELRGQEFLWAKDLSSYDAVITGVPFIGHISLFCVLMTVSNLIYTHLNSAATQGQQSMPGMKTMMYLMPIVFFFVLNSYPSGLSYYYFVANVITISQMLIAKQMIDEKKLHAKLQANKLKPKKKSAFQRRLEEAAKQQAARRQQRRR